MDVTIRVAPEVRLRSTPTGLRADVPGAGERGTVATGIGSRGDAEGLTSLTDLFEQARQAQADRDLLGVSAAESALSSLHLVAHTPRRRPDHRAVDPGALDPGEHKALHHEAFEAARVPAPVYRPAARAAARREAQRQADAFTAAVDTGRAVLGQHLVATADDRWDDLSHHDLPTVVSELDAAFAGSVGAVTCIDAGWSEDGVRGYATVVVQYPGPDLIGLRGPGMSGNGRPMLRRRTAAERNAVYLAGMASLVLATARQVVSVAVATDDVHVLLVRPASSSPFFEPLYLGSLSREAVTLRPPDADPLPLLLSAAARPMRFAGRTYELEPLSPAPDVTAVLARCAAAELAAGLTHAT